MHHTVNILHTQGLGTHLVEPTVGAVTQLRTVGRYSHNQLASLARAAHQHIRLKTTESTHHLERIIEDRQREMVRFNWKKFDKLFSNQLTSGPVMMGICTSENTISTVSVIRASNPLAPLE